MVRKEKLVKIPRKHISEKSIKKNKKLGVLLEITLTF